jgi:hypothetical protein
MIFSDAEGNELGNRWYLSYTGSAPTGANCTTLAGDIESAWASNLAPLAASDFSLVEVDVLDIATNSGLSGQWTGSSGGSGGSPSLPVQTAAVVEFGISRRYRGGKPKMYLAPPNTGQALNNHQFTSSYVTSLSANSAAFFAQIEALSIGAMGTLKHVNLSYFHGFTNITNSSGRERAVPTYRATALHDNVTGYFGKQLMGSQRRRRQSTTP